MPTWQKFNSFVEDVHHGVHNLSSNGLKLAFCAAANAPTATDGQLSDLTTVTDTYLADDTLTTSSSSQTSGTYKLVIADKTISASGGSFGPFRYVVMYNDTATNDELILWGDHGSEVTLSDGQSFNIDLSEANGVFQTT